MGARQSMQSEVEHRQRSNSTSEASTDRTRRFHRQRTSENASIDSDNEMEVGDFLASGSNQMRFSFRPATASHRISFLQALAAGMNGPAGPSHGQVANHARDRRSMPMLRLLVSGRDIKCPVCHKRIPSDDAEVHLVMCFTRPQIAYNEDVVAEAKGECAICLEEMDVGHTIARLPCLCIYHKTCIDQWFKRKNCCPEHPGDD